MLGTKLKGGRASGGEGRAYSGEARRGGALGEAVHVRGRRPRIGEEGRWLSDGDGVCSSALLPVGCGDER